MIAKYLHYIWTVLFFIHLYTLRRSKTRDIERIKRKSSPCVLSKKKTAKMYEQLLKTKATGYPYTDKHPTSKIERRKKRKKQD
jgi:hypothetical protein